MVYEVIHFTDVCNTEDCQLVCRKCNICIHNDTCECSDNIIKLNICKHIIHACAIHSSSNTQNKLCETTKYKIIVPAAEINLVEKSTVKTNTEYEQLFQIKNQIGAKIGTLSSFLQVNVK